MQAPRDDTEATPSRRWSPPRVLGPFALAVFQLAGTFGASQEQPDRRAVDVAAVLLVLAGPVALLWVRQRPALVVGVVSGVTLAYLLAGYAYGPVFLSLVVALFVAVVLGNRRAAWSAAALVYVGHFALRGVFGDEPWEWGAPLAVAAWLLLVLVAGEGVRVRRDRALDARRARMETKRRQANEERLRIARELHDVVAHHMSLINVQAGVALHLVDRKPEQARTALEAIKGASKEALVELRSLVGVLRDESAAAPRSPVSMLGSLDDLAERSAQAGLSVRRVITGAERPLPAALQLGAFRIVQEAITNVVRHSGAQHVDVRLEYGADVLTVRVDDDGTGGPNADALEQGSGLRAMRERAVALGGTLSILPAARGGLRIEAVLPIGGER